MTVLPSPLRTNVLRVAFFLNFVVLGLFVLRALMGRAEPWEPVRGVAYSFWGALALLSALGVRYPLSMVPLLLMQLVYKSIWLAAIYPRAAGDAGLLPIMVAGVIGDLIVMPWPYMRSLLQRRS